MYIIYKHTSPSGHSYIGYTFKEMMIRWNEHLLDSLREEWKFSKALRKYPNENQWIHEILIDNILIVEEAKNLEVLCIFYYDTFIHGYNSTRGGDGSGPCSEKTRRKISKALKGKLKSYEHRKHLSESQKGKKFWLGKHHTEETKRKIGLRHIGKKHSNETKQKQSKSHRLKNTKKQTEKFIESRSRYWQIIWPNNIKIEIIKNLNQFCRDNKDYNLSVGHMCRVAQGKRKHHHGFKCIKIEENVL